MPDTLEEKLKHKEASLFAEITRLLPDFAKSCRENKDMVIIHQDSFAADYRDEEYVLLGKAIKFAGMHGRELRIVGKKYGNDPRVGEAHLGPISDVTQ